ncbi:MAG TPA: sensory rhodopsin transducer, partial [Adhaeribacter sp.]|nr:sensory rhodopsin transducer [Adhaeribacter sp.]
MTTKAIGKKHWVIPGGNVPVNSTGHEPEFTSHDKLSILNTGSREASVALTIYFSGREPYGPYELKVEANRVKKVRFNDLIDPLAIPLGEPFACSFEA